MKILPSPIFPVRAAAIKRGDDFLQAGFGHDHLYLYFRKKIHFVLLAAINLLVALLASVPAPLSDGQALRGDGLHGMLDFVQFERLYNRLDFFHRSLFPPCLNRNSHSPRMPPPPWASVEAIGSKSRYHGTGLARVEDQTSYRFNLNYLLAKLSWGGYNNRKACSVTRDRPRRWSLHSNFKENPSEKQSFPGSGGGIVFPSRDVSLRR